MFAWRKLTGCFNALVVSSIALGIKLRLNIINANVVLEWNFSPTSYFEEVAEIVCRGHVMKIADGKVETRINAEIFAANLFLREKLHNWLNNQFLIQQLLTGLISCLSQSQ